MFHQDQELQNSLLSKFKAAVASTRQNLVTLMEMMIQGQKTIDADMLDELEGILVSTDIGIETSTQVLETVRSQVNRQLIKDGKELKACIKSELLHILETTFDPVPEEFNSDLEVILVVGVNGVGKTTTTGKLASRFRQAEKTVLVCAADTFRAAAAEQLEEWGKRARVNVIRQQSGSDPSAVLFDAINAAKARKVDILIVDTAGRLHTKNNLMMELEKMKRIAGREVIGAPHQILLVIDATTGQNGLIQAKEFTRSTGVSGIILTKIDGTAKGGVVVGITRDLKIPIRYVGVGEQIEDLIPFSPKHFINSLFD